MELYEIIRELKVKVDRGEALSHSELKEHITQLEVVDSYIDDLLEEICELHSEIEGLEWKIV